MSKPAIKSFDIHKPSFRSRYDIIDAQSGASVLVADINDSRRKPDIVLQATPSSSSQVIGVARIRKGIAIGIASPPHGELTYEAVDGRNGWFSNTSHSFNFTMDDGRRKRLQWEKTGLFSGGRGFKLTDEAGNVLAEMKKGMLGTSGTLDMAGILGQRFETMVLVSCLAVVEEKRRRDNRNAATGSVAASSAAATS